jgi:prolyl-tRNA editing enzyme YbaK/EbsC (Cys-tRNA(Pro) deacylase)
MIEEDPHICVGVCMADPDSGYCLGCGRPPPPSPTNTNVVVEKRLSAHDEVLPAGGDPDTPTA